MSCFLVYTSCAPLASALSLPLGLACLLGESELWRNKLLSEQMMERNRHWEPSLVCCKEKEPFGLHVEAGTAEAAFL